MRVINIYPNFSNQGGAQNVVIQLSHGLRESHTPIVLTNTPLGQIDFGYKASGVEFRAFGLRELRCLADEDTIFISHHRKTTTLLMLYQVFLGKRLRVLHVAHSTFDNLRYFSLFPRHNIAVSRTVSDNLRSYFGIAPERIQVIYNGLKDTEASFISEHEVCEKIRILHIGRICTLKQQVKLVQATMGELNSNIEIYFAGRGEEEEELATLVEGSEQYHYLGQISVEQELPKYDYILLFSIKEGLPLSLLEACKYGKPMITNTIDAVKEINTHEKTGFVCHDFSHLIETVNKLPHRGDAEYCDLSRQARIRYEEKFVEERMLDQYRSILRTIFTE